MAEKVDTEGWEKRGFESAKEAILDDNFEFEKNQISKENETLKALYKLHKEGYSKDELSELLGPEVPPLRITYHIKRGKTVVKREIRKKKLPQKLENGEHIKIKKEGMTDKFLNGVYKLFTSKDKFKQNYLLKSPDGYEGFISVKEGEIIEAQDLQDTGAFFAIKISELPDNDKDREKIAVNHGFFSSRGFIGGGKNWNVEDD